MKYTEGKKLQKKRNNKTLQINNHFKDKFGKIKQLMKKLNVEVIDDPIDKAIQQYIYHNKSDTTLQEAKEYFKNDKDFIERITLNFIRHNYSNYDYLVRKVECLSNHSKLTLKQKCNKLILRKYKGKINDYI